MLRAGGGGLALLQGMLDAEQRKAEQFHRNLRRQQLKASHADNTGSNSSVVGAGVDASSDDPDGVGGAGSRVGAWNDQGQFGRMHALLVEQELEPLNSESVNTTVTSAGVDLSQVLITTNDDSSSAEQAAAAAGKRVDTIGKSIAFWAGSQPIVCGARFSTAIYVRGCHWFPLLLA
jgi:hypothetical protein